MVILQGGRRAGAKVYGKSPSAKVILAGLARGYTMQRIAADHGVVEGTVVYHMRKIAKAAGIPCRPSALVNYGYETGLLAKLKPSPEPWEELKPRETIALRLAAKGLMDKVIAQEMGVTPDTVKAIMKRCMAKMGAQGRAQAVAIAWQHGYLGSSAQLAEAG